MTESPRYFAAYCCRGGGCSYMGPDLPPDACPVHDGHAIADYSGRTIQQITGGISPDGWEHCDGAPVRNGVEA